MEIYFTDFSAPVGASVFKFFVHLQVGKVDCVNENKDAKSHFAIFFNFPFYLSFITHMGHFRQFSQQLY